MTGWPNIPENSGTTQGNRVLAYAAHPSRKSCRPELAEGQAPTRRSREGGNLDRLDQHSRKLRNNTGQSRISLRCTPKQEVMPPRACRGAQNPSPQPGYGIPKPVCGKAFRFFTPFRMTVLPIQDNLSLRRDCPAVSIRLLTSLTNICTISTLVL